MTTIKLLAACLLAMPSVAAASPIAKKSGTLDKEGCQTLDEVRLCFNPSESPDSASLFVGSKRTRLLGHGWDNAIPYEIERGGDAYRVKIGTPSRSDIDFFAYAEVKIRKVGGSFRVDRYTIATDSECEGSPDIRMIYEFDLRKRTMTAVLAPPWSSDNKVHRFVQKADLKTSDPFRLSEWDFINLLGERPVAAIQRLCSA